MVASHNYCRSMADVPSGPPPAAQREIDNLAVSPLKAPETCVVCMEAMDAGFSATGLPCGHTFHGACVAEWLQLHNNCPVCRYELLTDDPSFNEQVVERQHRRSQSLPPCRAPPASAPAPAIGSVSEPRRHSRLPRAVSNGEMPLPRASRLRAMTRSVLPRSFTPDRRPPTPDRRPPPPSTPERHASLPSTPGRRGLPSTPFPDVRLGPRPVVRRSVGSSTRGRPFVPPGEPTRATRGLGRTVSAVNPAPSGPRVAVLRR